jgi:hypothetical protein
LSFTRSPEIDFVAMNLTGMSGSIEALKLEFDPETSKETLVTLCPENKDHLNQ